MDITVKEYNRFIKKLSSIDGHVSVEVGSYIAKNGGFRGTDLDDLISYCYGLVNTYGNAAATWAAEMYDAVAELSGVNVPPAIPADTATYGDVAKTVLGVKKVSDTLEMMAGAVSRLTKLAAQDTIIKNAVRDGAQVAWIPRGDTCAFCIALASRGWQYASKDTIKNGHAEHIHGNCDCSYAVRFNEKLNYPFYKPEKYKRIYYDADGDINEMRRDAYQKNKEKINEQKRNAYQRSKELESSRAEEIDVG